MKIHIEVELPEEFYGDILVTAFDGSCGGCWYWAEPHGHPYIDDGTPCIEDGDGERVWQSVEIIEQSVSSGAKRKWATINHEMVARGIQRILSGEVKVNQQILSYISKAVTENDCGHIDSDAADCIIQAAMFGELVYG